MAKTILLLDCNNLGYAAQSASPLSYEGKPTHAIFHFMKMLKTIAMAYHGEDCKLIALWDSTAKWRYELYPEYKGDRDKDEESVKRRSEYGLQRPTIVKALTMLGVDQIVGAGYEADDIAGFLAQGYAAKGNKVLLVSGDKDWIQLVSGMITWYDPIRERSVKRSNFSDFTGYQDAQGYVEAKALEGDSSDCIAGVPGIGEKASLCINQEYGSVEGLFARYDQLGRDFEKNDLPASLTRYRKKLNEFCGSGRDVFYRNMKLMDLRTVPVDKSRIVVVKGDYQPQQFRNLCINHAFHSIIREFNSWERLFGETA